ncbi:hypothetical protein [Streptomyces sp. JW3]|uniref:hypothetical protein n=1 Tax=Streptomyces sp. JW3 TaxID=3456955 RepID=UPI003FA4C8C4
MLAEWATGDTKALVAGTPLEQLVLRALARRTGDSAVVPRDRAVRRAVGERRGHRGRPRRPGTRPQHRRRNDTVVCDWLRDAADFGIPCRAQPPPARHRPRRPRRPYRLRLREPGRTACRRR